MSWFGFVNKWCEEFSIEVSKGVDEYILAQFERHGYSKNDVIRLASNRRLIGIESTIPNWHTTYIVEDVGKLFTIYKEAGWRVDENDPYKLAWFCNLWCVDHREVKAVKEERSDVKENME